MSHEPVLVIAPHPVWQTVLRFDALALGEVNRAVSSRSYASGKGANLAIAMERNGHRNLSLLQPLGGVAGSRIDEDLKRFELKGLSVPVSCEARTCTTLLDPIQGSTELISPHMSLSKTEWKALAQGMEPWADDEKATLVLAGSLPGGDVSPFLETLQGRRASMWLDAVDQRLLACRPEVLKINRFEWEGLGSPTQEKIKGDAEVCIVTDQDRAVRAWVDGASFEIIPPPLQNPLNTIAAGDTFMGTLVCARRGGRTWRESIELAAARATEKCDLLAVEDLPTMELL